MTDIARFWGVLAVFFGAAFVVVSVVKGDGVSFISLVVAWGIIAAGLVLVMLATIAESLQRISDLQISPENRFIASQSARQVMMRSRRVETSTPSENEDDPPPHRRPIPAFRRNP